MSENCMLLGAVHKCQYFHECTNNTLSENPSPQKIVHINIFWVPKIPMKIIRKTGQKVKSVQKKCRFSQTLPPQMLAFMDGPLMLIMFILKNWKGSIFTIHTTWHLNTWQNTTSRKYKSYKLLYPSTQVYIKWITIYKGHTQNCNCSN